MAQDNSLNGNSKLGAGEPVKIGSKRSASPSDIEVPTKRAKLVENGASRSASFPRNDYSRSKVSCQGCRFEIKDFICRDITCVCRNLKRLFCEDCVLSKKRSRKAKICEDSEISPVERVINGDSLKNDGNTVNHSSDSPSHENHDQKDRISIVEAFNLSRHCSEAIFKLFERKKKRLLWLSHEEFGKGCPEKLEIQNIALAHPNVCCQMSSGRLDDIVEKYKSKFLQYDFNFVEMSMQDEQLVGMSERESLEHLNNAIADLYRATAQDSLVFVVFRLENRAICCAKVRSCS